MARPNKVLPRSSPFARGREGVGVVSCHGLSLLEVLVAFSILALALGVLLRIFGSGLKSAALAESYSQAVLRAESLLSRSGIDSPLQAGEESGAFDERYHWRRLIRPYPLPDIEQVDTLPLMAFEVIVEVFWQEASKRHSVTLTSLRLVPRGLRER